MLLESWFSAYSENGTCMGIKGHQPVRFPSRCCIQVRLHSSACTACLGVEREIPTWQHYGYPCPRLETERWSNAFRVFFLIPYCGLIYIRDVCWRLCQKHLQSSWWWYRSVCLFLLSLKPGLEWRKWAVFRKNRKRDGNHACCWSWSMLFMMLLLTTWSRSLQPIFLWGR